MRHFMMSAVLGLVLSMPGVTHAIFTVVPPTSPGGTVTGTGSLNTPYNAPLFNGQTIFMGAPSGLWYDPINFEIFNIIPPSPPPLFDAIELPSGINGTVTVGSNSDPITGGTLFIFPAFFSNDVASFSLSYDSPVHQPLEIIFTGNAAGNFSETVVPLPSAAMSGLALFGVLGLGYRLRRAKPTTQ